MVTYVCEDAGLLKFLSLVVCYQMELMVSTFSGLCYMEYLKATQK